MSKTATEMTHAIHIPREDAWVHARDNALIHAAKELGTEGMAVALTRVSAVDIAEEALRQLSSIAAPHRDENGLIITGLLDLTKLGLTREEASARHAALNAAANPSLKAVEQITREGNLRSCALIDDVSGQIGLRR